MSRSGTTGSRIAVSTKMDTPSSSTGCNKERHPFFAVVSVGSTPPPSSATKSDEDKLPAFSLSLSSLCVAGSCFVYSSLLIVMATKQIWSFLPIPYRQGGGGTFSFFFLFLLNKSIFIWLNWKEVCTQAYWTVRWSDDASLNDYSLNEYIGMLCSHSLIGQDTTCSKLR